ncbi:hypothetical protein M2G63_06120 [Vibrio vulnificus]|nr:hypothetical protein [Vibrio vulnificus]EKZ9054784.1 hypothetical protein [Vibrio vulnificus]MCU8392246.1 hypothetical protein [Vibrio vulnificus]MCU8537619.1 hypothetical protein [Vibrio vulnificus]MCU8541416.1 hypothetical protein [Vibrio vulnificus]
MSYTELKVDDLVSLDNYKLRLVKVEPDIYISKTYGLSVFINDYVKGKIRQVDALNLTESVISIRYFKPDDYLSGYYRLELISRGGSSFFKNEEGHVFIYKDLYEDLFTNKFDVLIDF